MYTERFAICKEKIPLFLNNNPALSSAAEGYFDDQTGNNCKDLRIVADLW